MEEWIYHNSPDGVSRVRPDGSVNELVVEDVSMDDMSLDKSKLLFFGNHIITIMDIESMVTQTIGFQSIVELILMIYTLLMMKM